MHTQNNETQIILPDEIIMNKILIIQNKKVMIDKDLAELYDVETRALNQAVLRNRERFPKEFMFQLSQSEFDNLKSHFVISSWGGTRKLPYVFTEQGVAMLSSVLKSKKAIQVNIQIMLLFTKVREMLTDNLNLRIEVEEIKKKLNNHSKNIELVFQYLDELIDKKENAEPRVPIGYKLIN